jgi:hypothetical protein
VSDRPDSENWPFELAEVFNNQKLDCAQFRGRNELAIDWVPGYSRHCAAGVMFANFAACGCVPQSQGAITRSRSNQSCIGRKCTCIYPPRCPASVASSRSVANSHTFKVPSSAADTIRAPSGENEETLI